MPRRVAALGVAILVLAGAGIAAAATYEDDDDTSAALEQPATTTTSTSSPAPETTTTLAVTTTSVAAPTTVVAATTTTRRGATTTTTRGATTTTTTAGTTTAACTTAQIEAVVGTDKGTYVQGEPVKITSMLRNRSNAICAYPSFVFSAGVLSPAGTRVAGFDRTGESPGALGPGQALEASVTWERLGCTPTLCMPSPAGTYSVTVTWNFPGGPYPATQSIQLT